LARNRLAALLAIAATAVFGCASESTLLREDPGFTAASLRSGGIVVLGAVQVDEVTQSRPPLIEALQRVLRGARKDVPLVTNDRVQAALGDSAMRLFLLGYQMRGDPDSVWLLRAADAAHTFARYGVLARIEGTSIRYGTREVPPIEASGEGGHSVRATGRDVQVQMTVYDLATRGIVYRAKFLGSSDAIPYWKPPPADTTNPDSIPPKQTWVQGPSQSIRPGTAGFPTPGPSDSPSDLGYPDAPPVARAAESAFLTFARSLPGGQPPQP